MPARYSLSEAELNGFPILTPMEGNESTRPVALDRPVCVVGSRARVHLPLGSRQISKAQALIIQETVGVYLRDLSSKNQTFVNDRAIRESRLEDGDCIQFGPLKYLCRSGFTSHGQAGLVPVAELHLRPDGSASRQIVPVKQYSFVIGSRQGCDLLLDGPEIAWAHAVIFARNGRRFLRDLSSRTGTFVNEQRIREVELREGDEIRIGASRIEYYPVETPTDDSADDSRLPWDEDQIKVHFDDGEIEAETSSVGAA